MTMFLMDLVTSLSGRTLSLKPEKPPEAGGCHLRRATLPSSLSMLRFDGGSGAVVIEAVQVNQSAMLELE